MESITPNIFVKDMRQAIAFYQKLGFEVVVTVPDQGEPLWAMMSCGAVGIMFQTIDSLGNELPEVARTKGGSLLLYIKIKGIQTFFHKISSEVKVLKGLEKTFYGATEFSILDNNGYVLTFAEDI